MAPGKKVVVTKELIVKVYEYKQKFGDKISNMELSKLVGVSDSTIGRIFKGEYDYLLKDESKDTNSGDVMTKLSGITEQLYKMNNGIQFDHTELGNLLEAILEEATAIGDLLHETDKTTRAKMADQIQHVHTNKRLSEALKK